MRKTKNLRKVLKTNSGNGESQLAIEKTQKETSAQPPREKTQTSPHPGVSLDTSLKSTLEKIKNSSILFKIHDNLDRDLFWSGIEVRELGGSKTQLGHAGEDYAFKDNIQTGVLNRTLWKNLKDSDIFSFDNLLKILEYNEYKFSPGAGK